MQLCQNGKNILSLLEEFKQGNKVFLVTKLAKGGDLVSYLQSIKVTKLPEL